MTSAAAKVAQQVRRLRVRQLVGAAIAHTHDVVDRVGAVQPADPADSLVALDRSGSLLAPLARRAGPRWSSSRIWRFEGGEHRLDHKSDACFGDLAGRALPGLVLVGHDQPHADELETVVVFSSAVTGVGAQEVPGCALAS